MKNCGLCGKEARLVDDLGLEMGAPYYFCRGCKKDESEWTVEADLFAAAELIKAEGIPSAPGFNYTEYQNYFIDRGFQEPIQHLATFRIYVDVSRLQGRSPEVMAIEISADFRISCYKYVDSNSRPYLSISKEGHDEIMDFFTTQVSATAVTHGRIPAAQGISLGGPTGSRLLPYPGAGIQPTPPPSGLPTTAYPVTTNSHNLAGQQRFANTINGMGYKLVPILSTQGGFYIMYDPMCLQSALGSVIRFIFTDCNSSVSQHPSDPQALWMTVTEYKYACSNCP